MKVFNYSKYNHYTWDNEILGYISQIHEYKGKLKNLEKENLVKINKLIEIAKIQSTEYSNKIEGIVTTNTRLKQLYNEKTTPKTRDEKEIIGYRDVLNTIYENFKYITLNPSYILQLHRDLYKFSNKPFGGQFKNVQNYISETREDGSSFVRFKPLAPYETPTAVKNLCEEFNIVSSKQEVCDLILIPIFVLDFLCIHPFNDGNGRMSRLLTILLLYKFGYNVGKFISIEKIIENTKDEYYSTLQESSLNWIENNNNPEHFIKYMLKIILKAYRDLDERTTAITDKKVSAIIQIENAINKQYGKFYKKDIIELCPTISQITIERNLKKLLDENKIEKHGERKSTYYTRKD